MIISFILAWGYDDNEAVTNYVLDNCIEENFVVKGVATQTREGNSTPSYILIDLYQRNKLSGKSNISMMR